MADDWPRVAVAVVLGAATHLAWDSFTHRGRWGTELIPWLNDLVLTLGGHGIPGFKVLQYGSTVVGLPILAILGLLWLRRQSPKPVEGLARLTRGGRVAVLAGMGSVAGGAVAWAGRLPGLTPYERLGQGITTAGFALGLAVMVYAILFQGFSSRAEGRSDRR